MSNLFPAVLTETEISDWRERLESIWHELYQEKNGLGHRGKDFTSIVEQVFSRHLPSDIFQEWKPRAIDNEKEILDLLEKGKEELDKYVRCEFVTAKSLSYSAVEKIKQKIASQINQKIVLKISIDPSIGCGFVAHWKGRIHDFSFQELVGIERLKKQFL